MGFLRILTPSKASTESGAAVGGALPSSNGPVEENGQDIFFVETKKPKASKENGKGGLVTARTLIGVAKLLHDGLDVLSSGEQERQASALQALHFPGRY